MPRRVDHGQGIPAHDDVPTLDKVSILPESEAACIERMDPYRCLGDSSQLLSAAHMVDMPAGHEDITDREPQMRYLLYNSKDLIPGSITRPSPVSLSPRM